MQRIQRPQRFGHGKACNALSNTSGMSFSMATRPIGERTAPQDRVNAWASTTHRSTNDWKPSFPPRTLLEVGDPRQANEQVRRTRRDRSPVAPIVVQLSENLVQWCCRFRGRQWSSCRQGWRRRHLRPYCLGQQCISENRTSVVAQRAELCHNEISVCH